MITFISFTFMAKIMVSLLQTRTSVLNNELQDKFASWYPGCSIDDQRNGKLSAMAA